MKSYENSNINFSISNPFNNHQLLMELMIDSTNKLKVIREFHHIQKLLLYHKYLYYELNKPMLDDRYFDSMEQYSLRLAKNLGYRVDKVLGPDIDEKQHIHWMVGFDPTNTYWKAVKTKFKL